MDQIPGFLPRLDNTMHRIIVQVTDMIPVLNANVCKNLQQLHRIFSLYIMHNYAMIMLGKEVKHYATYNAN